MVGTAISVTSISLLAMQSQGSLASLDLGMAALGWAQAMVSALLMNISIVGINQLADVEIDKVNKPYLPLASGAFDMRTGWLIVLSTAAVSLAIGWQSASAALVATLVGSLILGILYSANHPMMRWKRSPVLAAACILVVRALAVQLGFFLHMQAALAPPAARLFLAGGALMAPAAPTYTPAVIFTLCFMLLFSVVIALFKDIPDAIGDLAAGVRTMTVRLGPVRVFWACVWILTAAYAGAITYSVLAAHFWSGHAHSMLGHLGHVAGGIGPGAVMMPASLSLIGGSGGSLGLRVVACVCGHALLAGLLWQRALRTDLTSNQDITNCYMHVWKLFYAEYILIPLLL